MLNKEQFLKEIENILTSRSILKHPFYQKWNEGKLTMADLQNYAKQYYFFVQHFPMFVSSVHSNCNDAGIRKMLVENIADEDGYKTGITDHPTLWKNFCLALGIKEKELESTEPGNAVSNMIDGFYDLCRSEDYRIGLAALYGYEKQVTDVAHAKIEGLKKHYAIDKPKDIEFFTVHAEADVHHSGAELEAILKNPADEKLQGKMLQAIEKSASYYWRLLDGLYVN